MRLAWATTFTSATAMECARPCNGMGDGTPAFPQADPENLYSPLILNPVYGYPAVNVYCPKRSGHSLLAWMKRIIGDAQVHAGFWQRVDRISASRKPPGAGLCKAIQNETVLVVNNLSSSAQAVELDLRRYKGNILVEMFGRNIFPRIGDLPYLLTMGPYQFFWFRCDGYENIKSGIRLSPLSRGFDWTIAAFLRMIFFAN